jgi:hypothetical protein
MSKARRSKPLHGDGANALTPESCGDSQSQRIAALLAECDVLRKDRSHLRILLASERKRHASVESVTVRYVNQLERQIEDLRSAVFQNLGRQFTPKPTETK